jgi:hypothetical protein
MSVRRKDTNQQAASLVAKATRTKRPAGEDLLGSPELQRQYLAAKAAAKKRR